MDHVFLSDRVKALVIASDWDIRSDLNEYLADFCVPSVATANFTAIPFQYLEDYQPDYIFISIDEFGGPALIYDKLLRLRQEFCEASIILISGDFEVDEYGTHRLPLADVSLRYPFTKASLFLALKQAPLNLQIWRTRSHASASSTHSTY